MLKRARDDLKKSGISVKEAAYAGMFSSEDLSEISRDFSSHEGLVIPYFDPFTGEVMTYAADSEERPFCRVRYYGKFEKQGFAKPKEVRYSQPKKSGVHAYFPQVKGLSWRAVAEDPSIPIIVTEGEKKALKSTLSGFPTIGLGGVYNFTAHDELLPELSRIIWKGRDVYLCFDSDAQVNPQVVCAEGRLSTLLSVEHGANTHLVRLPHKQDQKIGLDDYLVRYGEKKFVKVIKGAQPMRPMDRKIIQMNEHVCFIKREGLVLEHKINQFLTVGTFTRGSEYSAMKVVVPAAKGPGTKTVSLANEWLTHPHALRYDDTMFLPNGPRTAPNENGAKCLNMWSDFRSEEGSVEPFLELNEFIFSEMEGDQMLPLKLMAFRAQNPEIKVPLALLLIGTQGCGKSLWGEIVRDAFSPHGKQLSSGELASDYNGWLETCIVGLIDEVEPKDMRVGAETLKQWISGKTLHLNEKYRVAKSMPTYNTLIMTTNKREVGAFAHDDRRTIVINCPTKREDDFYNRISKWKNYKNGPAKLMNYLLNYDLDGWTPPLEAPMTAEKYMAYMESLTPVQRLAEDMKVQKSNLVGLWVESALQWAMIATDTGTPKEARVANEVRSAVSTLQIRPWYTPEELAMLFPQITADTQGRAVYGTVSGKISRELREAGVYYLRNRDDPRGFWYRGQLRQYLVIADTDDWKDPISQEEFEKKIASFPRYREWKNAQSGKKC